MSLSITFLSLNLCGQDPSDGSNPWARRKELCVDLLKKFRPIIFCIQAGLHLQLEYLKASLPGYDYFGCSRKGPEDKSDEFCAIYFDATKIDRIDGGTFWLSETPSVPGSTSWGAAHPRITNWATFQIRRLHPPGFTFQVMNMQLDDKSSNARRRGALLTWQHVASLPPTLPVVFCGDFNTDKESDVGRFFLGRSRLLNEKGDLRDAWQSARRRRNGGIVHTNHGFRGEEQGCWECFKHFYRVFCMCWDRNYQDLHSDWVFFKGRQLAPVFAEVVVDNKEGRFPSDHYPVYIEFLLPRSVRLLEGSLVG
eukprot:TRINITY_DN15915_c0_g1_i1.p1 TRINITY_DN15915_c0_g1~~TRINITY_DN15915_c0_g1_i1.p1  ORF type:complete len:309 (+),score=10.35 TRINITY_DN15915_c0_g1_i1:322-1248(+)